MKIVRFLLPCFFLFASCDGEPEHTFELTISSDRGSLEILYVLNENALHVYQIKTDSFTNDTTSIFQSVLNSYDTLNLIAQLEAKSYSCKEQHALEVNYVRFKNDSLNVMVDPGVNHPVELDYAVRLINSIAGEDFQLNFIDMQRAIEPDGKMRL